MTSEVRGVKWLTGVEMDGREAHHSLFSNTGINGKPIVRATRLAIFKINFICVNNFNLRSEIFASFARRKKSYWHYLTKIQQ